MDVAFKTWWGQAYAYSGVPNKCKISLNESIGGKNYGKTNKSVRLFTP